MEIPRGEITKSVYTHIKDGKFRDAVEILEQLSELQPNSRSALSLLGYCYFQQQNFELASNVYERLVKLYPDIAEYQLYLSQALYNLGLYDEALNASHIQRDCEIEAALMQKVAKLQAAIHYTADEIVDSRAIVEEKFLKDDPDTSFSKGCLEYKNGNYSDAGDYFSTAAKLIGIHPQLWYNLAVTNYRLGDIPASSHFIGEILEYAQLIHPEFKVTAAMVEDRDLLASVGNSSTLHKTALIEAINLKAAIEHDLSQDNFSLLANASQNTFKSLPPRNEDELDLISLHNQAVLFVKESPFESIRKLRFLLEQISFPPETLTNLLIIYCKYDQYDLIADVMAIFEEYKVKFVSPYLQSFFEAVVQREAAPDEAAKLLDELCNKLAEELRKITKKVEEAAIDKSTDETKKICNMFEEISDEIYAPALMSMGKIFWDREDLVQVEKVLNQGCEFLNDKDCWLTNVANVTFMRGQNYSEPAGFYELIKRKCSRNLMGMSAISLANLCVSYLLMQDEQAHKLLDDVVAEEKELLKAYPEVKVFHSCIINMVLGTLYCVKDNYNYGILRIIKSFDGNYKLRLDTDTWFYAKRCILSWIEKIVKNAITVHEGVLSSCVDFLEQCEEIGQNISTVIEEKTLLSNSEEIPTHYGIQTVTYEARYLRWLLIQAYTTGIIVTSEEKPCSEEYI